MMRSSARFTVHLLGVIRSGDTVLTVACEHPHRWALPTTQARPGIGLLDQLSSTIDRDTGMTVTLQGPVNICTRRTWDLTISFSGHVVLDVLPASREHRWRPIDELPEHLTLTEAEAIQDANLPAARWPVLRPTAGVAFYRGASGSMLRVLLRNDETQSPPEINGRSSTAVVGPAR